MDKELTNGFAPGGYGSEGIVIKRVISALFFNLNKTTNEGIENYTRVGFPLKASLLVSGKPDQFFGIVWFV